ncbi:TIGR03545 family protein [candidate division KSB1 bacterium]
MRKKGLIVLSVLFVLICAGFYFITDEFIEEQLESVLTNANGAKVEFDKFHISFFGLKAGWNKLQVTDPKNTMTNIVETGNAEFDMSVEPLFFGRWVIDELRFESLQSGTSRTTDGAIPVQEKPLSTEPAFIDQAVQNMNEEVSRSSGIDLSSLDKSIDVESVLSTLDLKTGDNLVNLQNSLKQKADHWEQEWQSLSEIQTKANEIKQRAETLRLKDLKQVDDFISAATTIKTIRDDARGIVNDFTAKKQAFVTDLNSAKDSLTVIDNWIKDDIKNAKEKANLPDLSTENIAKVLFGAQLFEKINEYTGYYEISRDYAGKLLPTEKVESPPRFKGQNISFPDRRKWPEFWIKKVVISGESPIGQNENSILLSGDAENITSDQKKIGSPTEIKLNGEKSNGREYELDAKLDYTQEISEEAFNINFRGISLNNTALGKNDMLPEKIDKGNMNVETGITLKDGKIEGVISILANNLEINYENLNTADRLTKIAAEIIQGIGTFTLETRFSGSPGNLNLSMSSNLDELFSNRFKDIIGSKIEEGRAEIENQVRQRIEPEKQKILALYNDKISEFEGKFSGLEDLIDSNTQFTEEYKQQILDRIDSESNPLLKLALQKVRDIIKW